MAVTIVNGTELLDEIQSHEKVIVKYYTEWCGSCRLFKPKFIRLSDDERFQGIRFLDVDPEKNPEARKAAVITHYPSFVIFRSGEFSESIATTKSELVEELLLKLVQMD
jgi:thiol-disulfide isomerase/thioredoxin